MKPRFHKRKEKKEMKNITAYDAEANLLEEVAERNNLTVAEVVEALCDYLEECAIDNNWKHQPVDYNEAEDRFDRW